MSTLKAIGTLILLLLINVAGVAWVVRFQIVLALVLFASAVDFLVGPAVNRDRPELENLNSTVVKFGYNSSIFEKNLYQEWEKIAEAGIEVASFTKIHEYFVIFGIIFPSITGVFAGVGMSGDLKNPAKVRTQKFYSPDLWFFTKQSSKSLARQPLLLIFRISLVERLLLYL